MNVVGIIAEYNPFHEGHAYQIQKAKEQCGAEFAVVVMNGDLSSVANLPFLINIPAQKKHF